ncbi:MAG: hypothetical protein M1530_01990 [Candidatus Marsarchaeota archaeon]|nr:hypothetical protein [Candidatus Marsarchaeota archaeon]
MGPARAESPLPRSALALMLAFCLLSIPILYVPTHVDEWVFLYVGQHMSLDKMPYRDFADNKGPITYLFYRGLWVLFGLQTLGWRLAYLALILIASASLFRISRSLGGDGPALIALAVYLVLMLSADHTGLDAFAISETIGMAPMLLALERSMVARREWEQALNGLLLSLAVLTNVLFWPAVPAFLLLAWRKQIKVGRAFWAGLALLPALFVIVLMLSGSFGAWWDWTIRYHFSYAQSSGRGPLGVWVLLVLLNLKHHLLLLAVLLPFLSRRLEAWRPLILAFALLAAAPFARTAASDLGIDHYEIPALPLYALGAAMLYAWAGPARLLTLLPIVLALLALTAFFTAQNLQFPAQKAYEEQRLAEIGQKMAFLRGGSVWTGWDINEAMVYQALNATAPGRDFFSFVIFRRIDWVKEEETRDFVAGFGQGRIPYVLIKYPIQKWGAPACFSDDYTLPLTIRQTILDNYDCRDTGIAFDKESNVTLCTMRK